MILCENPEQSLDCVVYWIRAENHEDITSEGYVGVSINFQSRLKQHNSRLKNKRYKYTNLYSSIKQFKSVVAEIVYEGTASNCYELEKLLRPFECIAWNKTAGGRGHNTSGEYQSNIYFLENPQPEPPSYQSYETCLLRSIEELKLEYDRLGESDNKAGSLGDRIRRSLSKRVLHYERGPWANPANTDDSKNIYMIADQIYTTWIEYHKPSDRRLGNILNFKARYKSLKTLINLFRQGFVPQQDKRWTTWINEQRSD
jgi:hypothetical protein